MSDLVTLTEDKLSQLENQLVGAYNSIFRHDSQQYQPKERTVGNVIQDHLGLIALTALGTFVLLKVSENYVPVPKFDWDF